MRSPGKDITGLRRLRAFGAVLPRAGDEHIRERSVRGCRQGEHEPGAATRPGEHLELTVHALGEPARDVEAQAGARAHLASDSAAEDLLAFRGWYARAMVVDAKRTSYMLACADTVTSVPDAWRLALTSRFCTAVARS